MGGWPGPEWEGIIGLVGLIGGYIEDICGGIWGDLGGICLYMCGI